MSISARVVYIGAVGGANNDLNYDNKVFDFPGNAADVYAGFGNDYISASSEQFDDLIDGGLGTDIIRASGGYDIIYGDSHTIGVAPGEPRYFGDQILGGDGSDIIFSQSGPDYVNGEAGDDMIYGGAGEDLLQGGLGIDQINGGEGNDVLRGNSSSEVPVAYQFSLTLSYNGITDTTFSPPLLVGFSAGQVAGDDASADYLNGGDGNDVMIGGLGDDLMVGGLGDDTFEVTDLGDRVLEGSNEGSDTVFAYVTYNLPTNVETLVLAGGALGGNGNADANKLIGNDLANQLVGWGGNDTLTGGGGDDRFYFLPAPGGFGVDHITDFNKNGDDTLLFSSALVSSRQEALAACWQVGADVYVAQSANNIVVLDNTVLTNLTLNDFAVF